MNRPPGPSDWWFSKHQAECGGSYAKISEPEPKAKKLSKPSKQPKSAEPRLEKENTLFPFVSRMRLEDKEESPTKYVILSDSDTSLIEKVDEDIVCTDPTVPYYSQRSVKPIYHNGSAETSDVETAVATLSSSVLKSNSSHLRSKTVKRSLKEYLSEKSRLS
eukprot:Blabericola_migrator_1__1920@NODE_1522_length_4352_cov_15_201867_g1002_i0_p5_GENE_NODE_1522_length_4352_cov_15_201867_g1002_i0NODE_1522_length_4352_cov_15_201867_g1002_i0_p5_ORF_typecomplete_len162_score15_68_NODE_1522_length_4352_cov_15_201867_g1002_i0231716